MTGSVGIITADQLKDQAQPTVDALMQGKIAGVAVSAVTGQPGSTQKYESEVPTRSLETDNLYGLLTEYPYKKV